MKYNILMNEWSDSALECKKYERFTVHPWNDKTVIGVDNYGAVRVLDIATGRIVKEFKSQLGGFCPSAVRCVVRAPNNEFLVIFGFKYRGALWKVFSSATDTYSSNLPWTSIGENAAAAVLDERNAKFFYHANNKNVWTCVDLPK